MSSPQEPTGDNSRKNFEQITFRFCSECSNMLYPKEDPDSHKLQFTCRTCQYTEGATSTCVFRNLMNNAVGETAGVTQDVGSDPTVSQLSPTIVALESSQTSVWGEYIRTYHAAVMAHAEELDELVELSHEEFVIKNKNLARSLGEVQILGDDFDKAVADLAWAATYKCLDSVAQAAMDEDYVRRFTEGDNQSNCFDGDDLQGFLFDGDDIDPPEACDDSDATASYRFSW
ncbi:hypothetical protein PFICI_03654 [Pestalotiopsis fici W106-1]|uniref:DNA-directed RNA polymerase II subunit RPB9-like zinc ribbon domain-containing protein n=1 Tax=Pestalotiopsis fici (strain W106-1 / CGMCC3.15140) TaxID=1229662 RepID=W3XHZ8_PESFW|nr:uncharacterized protein PFICI_03654 [Pestalotiopsis fici W106-1]ETS85629.1 hypothetical protein PFICI_03654 [Pestalotiopsis fici W106-1]